MTNERGCVLHGHIIHAPQKEKLEIKENGYLICEHGLVAGVFDNIPEQYKHLPVEECENQLIIPGMVDLHIHAPQYAFRGMGMDWELIDWLKLQTFPEEEKYEDLNYAQKAYGIFADQMKKSATTRASIFATKHRKATELLIQCVVKPLALAMEI